MIEKTFGLLSELPSDRQENLLPGRGFLQSRLEAGVRRRIPRRPVGRVVLLCAAAAVLLAGTSLAVASRWHLPAPTPYEPTEQGTVKIHESRTCDPEAPEKADESDIQAARNVLSALSCDRTWNRVTVRRQTNLVYGREETEVTFGDENGGRITVCLSPEGTLWSLSADEGLLTSGDLRGKEAAEACYGALPVPAGYVLCAEYTAAGGCFYDFCRQIGPEAYNPYEAVRIVLEPDTGEVRQIRVFSFGLLDDHGEEDRMLTEKEALARAKAHSDPEARGYTLLSAEVQTVLPNWFFTERAENVEYAKVSRYAWVLTFRRENLFADELILYIDAYTGELLGGDQTK